MQLPAGAAKEACKSGFAAGVPLVLAFASQPRLAAWGHHHDFELGCQWAAITGLCLLISHGAGGCFHGETFALHA